MMAAAADMAAKPRRRGVDASVKAMLTEARRQQALQEAEARAAAERKAQRRKKVRVPEPIGPLAAAEQRIAERERTAVTAQSPLHALLARKAIDATQDHAARIYLSDFMAQAPMKTMAYDRDIVDNSHADGDKPLLADRLIAYRQARAALGDSALLVDTVVILGMSCAWCASRMQCRLDDVTALLRAGLDVLALHYGLVKRTRAQERSAERMQQLERALKEHALPVPAA